MAISGLIDKIGFYSAEDNNQKAEDVDFVSQRLTDRGLEKLHEGLLDYKEQYEAKLEQYKEKYPLSADITETDINNRQFFREQFIQWLVAKNDSEENRYQGEPELRETSPEKATITMKELLDKQGAELYRLALEEELNSPEYMNAVFRTSTTHFEGEKWAQRPAIIVAGPSGCGKSFAAKAAVEKTALFLPKQDGDYSGNDVVSVDGGVAREVSQIRKLAIQLANNKGYTGVADLHSQSKVLEAAKTRVQEAAFATPTLGVVIPETFSSYMNPLDDKRNLLSQMNNLEDTRVVFCRVDGENSSLFKEIVAFMGSRRAWKTSNFEEVPLDLNNSNIPESKAYGAAGFNFGQVGSKLAELSFKKNAKEDLSILIINDLVLKKEVENPEIPARIWVDAKQDDKGATLISRRIFEEWEALPSGKQKLEDYMKDNRAQILIQTSGEMELAIVTESLRKNISRIEEKLETAKAKYGEPSRKVDLLEHKLNNLNEIQSSLKDLALHKDKETVARVREEVSERLQEMKDNGDFGYLKLSRSKSALKKTVSALDKLSEELNLSEESKAGDSEVIANKSSKRQDFSSSFKKVLHRFKPAASDDSQEEARNEISPKLGG